MKQQRRFAFDEPGENDEDLTVIVTEDWIRENYWPFWYEKMIEVHGKEKADNCTFQDCLDDWVACQWAWVLGEDGRWKAYGK